jgi:hypothetical protein
MFVRVCLSGLSNGGGGGGGQNKARPLRRVAEPIPKAPAPNSVPHINKMRRDLSRRPRCGHSEVCNTF